MSVFSLLDFATAIFGFVVSGILVFSPVKNRMINLFLGITFFVVAYRSITMFLMRENLIAETFLIGKVSFLYYLVPPCFYLYFKYIISDEQKMRKTDLVHFILPALAFLVAIYYALAGYFTTGEWSLVRQETSFDDKAPIPFYIQVGYHAIVLSTLAIGYCIASWKLVRKGIHLRRQTGEHPQVSKIRKWVLTLLTICSLLAIVLFIGAVLNWTFELNMGRINVRNLSLIRSALLIYIFSRVIVNSDLLLGIPYIRTELPVVDLVPKTGSADPFMPLPESVNAPESAATPVQPAVKEPSAREQWEKIQDVYFDEYGWITLPSTETPPASQPVNADKVRQYIEKINEFIRVHKPFRDPEFDMKTISHYLQVAHYHVEYVFRYYNKYSFTEFKNVLRVKSVIEDINRGKLKSLTAEALGLEAGFSSRSTFFRIFKSVTGKTPKQYGGFPDDEE